MGKVGETHRVFPGLSEETTLRVRRESAPPTVRKFTAPARPLAAGAQVHAFVLHGPPQALDENVVVAAPASVHADLDPVIRQHLGELAPSELSALISLRPTARHNTC
jgi:hypothetical protein